ncbi:hypothetical protein SAZ11_60900 [Streptomyces sp. FXJ1.4098]|nr:hypothetical protein [Streptomyces sp. FXJ1.4098]
MIQECIDYAEKNPREWPILFLDEINRTTSDVTSGALTLVTLRRMGYVELPKNVRIIVAGNDRGNVTSLDEASLSRFAIFHVEPDAATLMSVLGDNMNPWVKTVLTQYPGLIFQKSTPEPSSPTARTTTTTATQRHDGRSVRRRRGDEPAHPRRAPSTTCRSGSTRPTRSSWRSTWPPRSRSATARPRC